MERDSTADQPPYLGPGLANYPPVEHLVRVASPAVLGANVYPCFIQQLVPPLAFRDRESAYVVEPNGIILGPGYYTARLVSNYAGLPLLVTHCCPGGAFGPSSSSSPPASSGFPLPLAGRPSSSSSSSPRSSSSSSSRSSSSPRSSSVAGGGGGGGGPSAGGD